MAKKEVWKIVSRDRNYEVSSFGRVRRATPGKNTYPGKIRKLGWTGRYYQISFPADGWRGIGVHQIVAEAFLGSCPFGKQVNHKDLNTKNNRVSNLEYLTSKENQEHARRHGHWPVREKNGRAKLTGNAVRRMRLLFSKGASKNSLAKKFLVSRGNVQFILAGRTWK